MSEWRRLEVAKLKDTEDKRELVHKIKDSRHDDGRQRMSGTAEWKIATLAFSLTANLAPNCAKGFSKTHRALDRSLRRDRENGFGKYKNRLGGRPESPSLGRHLGENDLHLVLQNARQDSRPEPRNRQDH